MFIENLEKKREWLRCTLRLTRAVRHLAAHLFAAVIGGFTVRDGLVG